MPLEYFGVEMVMFRTEDGEVSVLDAFCPHMGAHLGHGGKVENGGIVCPFHAWKFDGAGKCTEVPYAKHLPRKANITAWPVIERNGIIMVWHDIDGKEPEWDIPEIPEWNNEEVDALLAAALEDPHAQPGHVREHGRQGALPLRTRDAGRSAAAHHQARVPAHQHDHRRTLQHAAGRRDGRARRRGARLRLLGQPLPRHRRDDQHGVGHADRRRVL